jgi:hypothetical protein
MRQDDALRACIEHRSDRAHGGAVHPHPGREPTSQGHLAQVGDFAQRIQAVFGINVKTIQLNILQYIYGSISLSLVAGGCAFVVAYFAISIWNRQPEQSASNEPG